MQFTCKHNDYTEEEQRKKKWLPADSPAFRALQGIVLDPNLLRDLRQMAQFKHTGIQFNSEYIMCSSAILKK